MSNKSIESQIAELCWGACSKLEFANRDTEVLRAICNTLSTELKAIAGVLCHSAIDRGVETLFDAGIYESVNSAAEIRAIDTVNAIRSIVACVANDAPGKSISKFMSGVLNE